MRARATSPGCGETSGRRAWSRRMSTSSTWSATRTQHCKLNKMSELELVRKAEYLKILRIALHARPLDFEIEDTVSANNAQHDAHSRTIGKLFGGILFSRKFILSYQLVLLGVLLLFTLLHWIPRLHSRWSQRRQGSYGRHINGIETGRSSSSSTLNANGATAEPFSKLDEEAPLLHGIARPQPLRTRMIYKIRALLVYQPSPIPIVNKTLPSHGCTVLVMLFLGLQAFYVFYKVPLSVATIFIFADRTALAFVANLPLLYLFAAKNQPIKYLTGRSYESLNIFHRRLGEIMCLLALLHSAGMLGVWYTILRPNGFTLGRFVASKIILLGKHFPSVAITCQISRDEIQLYCNCICFVQTRVSPSWVSIFKMPLVKQVDMLIPKVDRSVSVCGL